MADTANFDEILIIEPKIRSILPIENLHIPARLRKTIRKNPFEIKTDTAFDEVITACAEPHPTRPDTWINADIKNVFIELHRLGYAHSVECWRESKLVGGLYGLQLGSVFCGESMFSRESDTSKIALVYLAALLWRGGFTLLDAQFSNPHLAQFGQIEIPQAVYMENLRLGLNKECRFAADISQDEILYHYLDHLQNGAQIKKDL